MEKYINDQADKIKQVREKIIGCEHALERLQAQKADFRLKDKYSVITKHNNDIREDEDVRNAFLNAHRLWFDRKIAATRRDKAQFEVAFHSLLSATTHHIKQHDLEKISPIIGDPKKIVKELRHQVFGDIKDPDITEGRMKRENSILLKRMELLETRILEDTYTLNSNLLAHNASEEKKKKDHLSKMETQATHNNAGLASEIKSLKNRLDKLSKQPAQPPNKPRTPKQRSAVLPTLNCCSRCLSTKHLIKQCPHKHKDIQCTKCKQSGHVPAVCTITTKQTKQGEGKRGTRPASHT